MTAWHNVHGVSDDVSVSVPPLTLAAGYLHASPAVFA
jgi:hypothetical protein